MGAYIEACREETPKPYLAATSTADNIIYHKATLDEKKRKLKDANRIVELLFYDACHDTLAKITVLDSACGSGTFLVTAYDSLNIENKQIN